MANRSRQQGSAGLFRLALKNWRDVCWYDFVLIKKTKRYIYIKPRRSGKLSLRKELPADMGPTAYFKLLRKQGENV